MVSTNIELLQQVICCLGNITEKSEEVRNIIVEAGAVIPIANILDKAIPGSSFISTVSRSLSNLCKGRPHLNI